MPLPSPLLLLLLVNRRLWKRAVVVGCTQSGPALPPPVLVDRAKVVRAARSASPRACTGAGSRGPPLRAHTAAALAAPLSPPPSIDGSAGRALVASSAQAP